MSQLLPTSSDAFHSITLHQLKIFATVAQARSFARAAEALDVSQPTVTDQVQRLESLVGTRLFYRSRGRRFTELTRPGMLLLNVSNDVLQSLENVRAELDALRGVERGTVAFGADMIFTAYVLPRLHDEFRSAYPKIAVRVEVNRPHQLVSDLRSGMLDLVVALAPVGGTDLVVEPLTGFSMVLAGPPGHRLAGNSPAPFSALAQERLILGDQSTRVRKIIDRMALATNTQLRVVLEIVNPQACLQAALAGLGLTVLNDHHIGSLVETGRISILNVEGFPMHLEWVIARRRGELDPGTRLFKKHLQLRLAGTTGVPPE